MDELAELYQRLGLKIRSKPFKHQVDGLLRSLGKKAFAQLGEQGTGKTWILINEAALMFADGRIDSVLVLAPKGVDYNWQKDELRLHMPEGINYTTALWRAGANVSEQMALARLMGAPKAFSFEETKPKGKEMRWLLMNWEAIATDKGFSFAMEFLESTRALIICDEAQRVKAHTSKRAKALMQLKPHSLFRRIATGTPITNSPFDMFAPFKFLDSSILGTPSFFAFKTEHAQMVGPSDGLWYAMNQKIIKGLMAKGHSEAEAKKLAQKRMPQIVARDEFEKPIYKNLDKLRDSVAPHSFRVLKKECLDLPDKLYKNVYFDLVPKQRAVYNEAKDKLRVWLDAETIQVLTALTAVGKLSQISSGFFIETAEEMTHRFEQNPKADLLADILEDIEGKVIIWANFKEEMKDVAAACKNIPYVEYHGGIGDTERKEAIERFQHGDARIFIGHPKSGGTGLTLHAAQTVIYYSNSFSLEARKQSEDRAHRIGQKSNVTYIDLVARDTIEEKIIEALQQKSDLAALINGDLLR